MEKGQILDIEKQRFLELDPKEQFMEVMETIKNEKNEKVKAQLLKQVDESIPPLSSAEMKQQMGTYSDADMEKIKKLFSKQVEDIELQKIEKRLGLR